MSIDWIIGWPKKNKHPDLEIRAFMKRPDVQAIREILEDYLSGLYMQIEEHQPGFLSVKLKGRQTRMFKRHGGVVHMGVDPVERWFEVWVHKKGMTITTRMQDDVTNALATDFAKRCAQRWDGDLDEPS